MAKEASAETRASLKRLEGIDFDTNIKAIKSEIINSELAIEKNKAVCLSVKSDLDELMRDMSDIEDKIASVPAEIIDPVMTAEKIHKKEKAILKINAKKIEAQRNVEESKINMKKSKSF